MSVVFRASRYGQEQGDAPGEGDYLNCPMSREEYTAFYTALLEARTVQAHAFESERHFEGCMPIEALAQRGDRTLTFGPLKPWALWTAHGPPPLGHTPAAGRKSQWRSLQPGGLSDKTGAI